MKPNEYVNVNEFNKISNKFKNLNSNLKIKPKHQMLLNGNIVKEINIFTNRKKDMRKRSFNQRNKKLNISNTNLTDLWPVLRRSDRNTEKIIKDIKEKFIISCIVNNTEKGMRIIQTANKGRGVESTACFEKDSFIVEYAGKLMTEKHAKEQEAIYQKDSSKGSYMYYFRFKEAKYCVDATEESGRLGRLLNHSKSNPNCYVKVILINDVPRLAILAKREIELGEELLYDYGDRDKASIEANPWLKY